VLASRNGGVKREGGLTARHAREGGGWVCVCAERAGRWCRGGVGRGRHCCLQPPLERGGDCTTMFTTFLRVFPGASAIYVWMFCGYGAFRSREGGRRHAGGGRRRQRARQAAAVFAGAARSDPSKLGRDRAPTPKACLAKASRCNTRRPTLANYLVLWWWWGSGEGSPVAAERARASLCADTHTHAYVCVRRWVVVVVGRAQETRAAASFERGAGAVQNQLAAHAHSPPIGSRTPP
jgi:hypothetical protein